MSHQSDEPNFALPALPLDESGEFLVDFAPDEQDAYLAFFEEWRFVAVRVLDEAECAASIADLWDVIEQGKFLADPAETGIKRDDPDTWSVGWPKMAGAGFTGPRPIFTSQAFAVRQHPRVHQVYSALLGTEALWCSIDRYALFRPTNIRSEWATRKNTHFDYNPWRTGRRAPELGPYNNVAAFTREYNDVAWSADAPAKVQGLVNFADNRVEDGGFCICPKFPAAEWTEETRELRRFGKRFGTKDTMFCVMPRDSNVARSAVRVPLRAGVLFIWDSRMPHGSSPNQSDNPRYAQFVKMFPAQPLNDQRSKLLRRNLRENDVEVTDLGKKLLGFEEW